MKKVFIIAENITKLFFKKKVNIIIYFILPICITLISMVLYNGASSKINIGVYDADKSEVSINMINYLKKTGKFTIVSKDQKQVQSLVEKEKIVAGIIIPKAFKESILEGKVKEINLYSVKGQDTTIWLQNYIELYTKNIHELSIASEGNKDSFKRMYDGFLKENMKLNVTSLEDNGASMGTTITSMGIFIMFLMFGASSTSDEILKDRERKTYFRILSSEVSERQYLLGNFMANFLRALLQIIVILIIMMYVLKIKTYVPFLDMLIILSSFSITAIGLGMLVVSFSKSSNQSNGLMNLIVTPSCMLGGCFWNISLMPNSLQKVSNFVPQKWAIDAITKIQNGGSLYSIRLNLLIIMLFALVFFLISAYKISKRNSLVSY